MKLSIQLTFAAIISLAFIITGCDDPSNPFFRETDFSTVPDPIDYSNTEPAELENGTVYYIVEEGTDENNFKVERRDVIRIFLTLRLQEGRIVQSTYANNRTEPDNAAVGNLNTIGLIEGVIGMKEGETRVLVVPPEAGFGNVGSTSQYFQFREETLIYEVELVEILPPN